jgi:hypothetical protein
MPHAEPRSTIHYSVFPRESLWVNSAAKTLRFSTVKPASSDLHSTTGSPGPWTFQAATSRHPSSWLGAGVCLRVCLRASCLRSCVRFVVCSRVSCPGLRFV